MCCKLARDDALEVSTSETMVTLALARPRIDAEIRRTTGRAHQDPIFSDTPVLPDARMRWYECSEAQIRQSSKVE